MNRTLIDNSSEDLSMVTILKQCINTPHLADIRIATGYWDIPGLALIADELDDFLSRDGTQLRLLIGQDPYVYARMLQEPKYQGRQYPQDFIRTGLEELEKNLKEEHKQAIRLLLRYCEGEKPKIAVHIFRDPQNETCFFHSKCYIFTSAEHTDDVSTAIIGSSNWTKKGLEGNSELNYLENDYMRVAGVSDSPKQKSFVSWFEEKWACSDDWTQEFLEQVLKPSRIVEQIQQEDDRKELTPYELYIKLLQHEYGDIVDVNLQRQIETYLPPHFARLDYQIDAVKQCYRIMMQHGGFMLGDVVGLGKTVVGSMLIKHFLSMPDKDKRSRRVLIITPPAIQHSWKNTIVAFDQGREDKMAPHIDYVTTGSIGHMVDGEEEERLLAETEQDYSDTALSFDSLPEYSNYALIIIDESHKFRNANTAMYKSLEKLISGIHERTATYPYIGLLSATPQNNSPEDLKNQLYLFEHNRKDSTLRKADGGDLESFFSNIRKRYAKLIHKRYNTPDSPDYIPRTEEQRKAELQALATEIRGNVLEDILVRRTRTDVKKYYSHRDGQALLSFPDVSPPESLKYMLAGKLPELFSETMRVINPDDDTAQSSCLGYFRYRAIEYLRSKEHRSLYAGNNDEVKQVAAQLANIMQMQLVKRLESSFAAFRDSVTNLLRYTNNMMEMWQQDCIFICPDVDVNLELAAPQKTFEERAAVIRRKMNHANTKAGQTRQSNREYRREDFDSAYIWQLEHDRELLVRLAEEWKDVEDPKTEQFRKELQRLLPPEETTKKLVIFTESVVTLRHLVQVMREEGLKVLPITAENRRSNEPAIRENFDANYTGEWKNDYQVLISTDVLAEGVNLHRAYTLINYDTPWNATRLMQRIGRVNRLGSQAERIFVYNFMPSAEGDDKIQLVNRAYTKIQTFHTLFGEDNQVFSDHEEIISYEQDFSRLVDGEESPVMPYLAELKEFKQKHPQRYKQLESLTEMCEVATDAPPHESLFLLCNETTDGMYVRITQEGMRTQLSLSEMLAHFKTPEEAKACALPAGAAEKRFLAKLTFRQASQRLRLQANDGARSNARNVVADIQQRYPNLSQPSWQRLQTALSVLERGNRDICRRLLLLGSIISTEEQFLIPCTLEEMEANIEKELGHVTESENGPDNEGKILLALYR